MLLKTMMRPTMVLATIIYLIAFLPAIILAPFAAFLFDDPGAGGFIVNTFAILWFILPATLIAATLGAWITHLRQKDKIAGIFLLVPIINAVLIVIFGVLNFAS
ncbi:hypothetical protein N9L18_01355 [Candidatus Pacebacteria bacterium]|nr:hypothetical protein [Candidatus Paceibacterota bacterium]